MSDSGKIIEQKPVEADRVYPTLKNGVIVPQSFQEAFNYAKLIATSTFIPNDMRDKPANVMIAMQLGFEIGLHPMQALQSIAVINGRPTLWGDAMLALVQGSSLLEWIVEKTEVIDGIKTAICTVKRKGYPEPHTTKFSDADAKRAGLEGKKGPWSDYKDRMRQLRARGFCLRDQFADVLRGMQMREEQEDMQPEAPQIAYTDFKPRRKSTGKPLDQDSPKHEYIVYDEAPQVAEEFETPAATEDLPDSSCVVGEEPQPALPVKDVEAEPDKENLNVPVDAVDTKEILEAFAASGKDKKSFSEYVLYRHGCKRISELKKSDVAAVKAWIESKNQTAK